MTARGEGPIPEGRGGSEAGGDELFDLLRSDHRRIVELFDGIERCRQSERDTLLKLFGRLEEELQRHLEGEERFLFTSLEKHDEARDLVLENFELHQLGRIAIGAFNTLALDDERWRAKLKVLRLLAEHHISSQEEELFPIAQRILRREEVQGIMGQYLALKSEEGFRRGGLDAPR